MLMLNWYYRKNPYRKPWLAIVENTFVSKFALPSGVILTTAAIHRVKLQYPNKMHPIINSLFKIHKFFYTPGSTITNPCRNIICKKKYIIQYCIFE